MKSILFTNLLTILCLSSFCQSKVNESRQTKLNRDFQEYEAAKQTPQPRTKEAAPVTKTIRAGSRFTIVDETTLPNYYIVDFWLYIKDSTKRAEINFEEGSTTDIKFFVILKSELEAVSQKIYRRYSPTIGAFTFPFKYRPQNGKFETTFNIGVNGGVTWNPWRLNEHTFSLLGGISASSARIDQYNTGPAANITEVSERTSVTFSLSFLYQWERLQFGISAGIDNVLENETLQWKHQGKGWLSFGIGIGLFTASEIRSPGSN